MKSVFAVIIAILLSFPAVASAYVLEGQSWPQGTVVVLQLSLGDAGRTLQDGNTSWNAAVAPVATMWSQQLQHLQITNVMNSTVPVSSGDHQNSLVFANNVFGQPFGGSTVAVTYYRYSGSTMVEADTLFNRGKTFDSYRGPLQFPAGGGYAIADIRRVFLHELGHAIGLAHPDSAGQSVVAVMNSIMSNQEVLSNDDEAGGQVIYGAPVQAPPSPTPGLDSASHLANISTRLRVGADENVLIGGFIIRGPQTKRVMLRALGPSLASSGIAHPLSDPVIELHNGSGVMALNDNWSSSSQAGEISGTGLAPADAFESAMIVTLASGSYTTVVSGNQGGQGLGLVEVYELDSNATRLVNISTRGLVGVSEDVLIGGFIVQGARTKTALVRAIGPSLGVGPNPIPNALSNPTLELHDSSGALLGSNDDWGTSPQSAEIIATGLPPSDTRESALLGTFPAGSYTAIVRGLNNTTGIALVEVYDLDP